MTDIILPDPGADFEYVLVPKRKTILNQLKQERDRLVVELASMPDPINADLIELGKETHPYYMTKAALASVKEQILSIQ